MRTARMRSRYRTREDAHREIAPSLPPESPSTVYDRSTLIDRTIDTLKHALLEEIVS